MSAIRLVDFRKEYANGRGIHGLTLQVELGEIFGFLGPNGAGKSTTIRSLLGLLTPDGGRGSVLDHDVVADSEEVRRITGYLPSENSLHLGLSGRENLAFALAVRQCPSGFERAARLAEQLDVDLGCKLQRLSHGQRQKVAIIVALAHDPRVLILDEPTSGLDPLVRDTFFSLLREERDAGKAILMSSHVLSEVEALCSRVGIIRGGDLVEVSRVGALRQNRVKRVTAVFSGAPADLSTSPGVDEIIVEQNQIQFSYRGPVPSLLGLLSALPIVDFTVNDPSLEEVFRAYYESPVARNGVAA